MVGTTAEEDILLIGLCEFTAGICVAESPTYKLNNIVGKKQKYNNIYPMLGTTDRYYEWWIDFTEIQGTQNIKMLFKILPEYYLLGRGGVFTSIGRVFGGGGVFIVDPGTEIKW